MDKVDDRAIAAGFDLMIAMVLMLVVVTMLILIMPSLSHEDRSWRIKQYMVTTRATDNLVQDAGSPTNWEIKWNSNYSSVSKIGFLYIDTGGNANQKVLNLTKVKALMGEGYIDIETSTTWWEFPGNNTLPEMKANATRALGLEGYNFYMQLHPVDSNPTKMFNSTPLETNLSRVHKNDDTVSVVDRYVFINFGGEYLKYNNKAIHYRLNLWVW